MILTVTANPSIDRTVTLTVPLVRGAVHRAESATSEPGGKGVNVARALTLAGMKTVAVLPAPPTDPLVSALRAIEVPIRCVPTSEPVRTNLAITETDGTTTKLNEAGAALDADALAALTRTVLAGADEATWVVLSGSLPPGVPDGWYGDVVAQLADYRCRVAVDTSDRPLTALATSFHCAAPDLIKPNAEELAGLAGVPAAQMETAAAQGDLRPVLSAATSLVNRGAGAILATLGAAGAVLVEGSESWIATPPTITPLSTVGAGDASLAGYLRAAVGDAEPAERLRMAVAYGAAAAALPGSALPTPSQLDLDAVEVTAISPTTLSS